MVALPLPLDQNGKPFPQDRAQRDRGAPKRRMRREEHEDPAITGEGEVVDDVDDRGVMAGLVLARIGDILGHAEQALGPVVKRRREHLGQRDRGITATEADPGRKEGKIATSGERGTRQRHRLDAVEEQSAQRGCQVEWNRGHLQRLPFRSGPFDPAHFRRPANRRSQRDVQAVRRRVESTDDAATLHQQLLAPLGPLGLGQAVGNRLGHLGDQLKGADGRLELVGQSFGPDGL